MSGGLTFWNDAAPLAPSSGAQAGPVSAAGPDGTYITVWSELDGSGRKVIKGRVVDQFGAVVKDTFTISSTNVGSGLENPSISWVGSTYVVTYSGGTSLDGRVYRTHLNQNGDFV